MSGLLNGSPDVGAAFDDAQNTFFLLDSIREFDPPTGEGTMQWTRHGRKTRMSFSQMSLPFEPADAWEFPDEYGRDKILPFDVSFLSERVVRLRLSGGGLLPPRSERSPMLLPFEEAPWSSAPEEGGVLFESPAGALRIGWDPACIQLLDKEGKVLTRLLLLRDQMGLVNDKPTPTGVVRQAKDLRRKTALSLALAPGEAIAGGGESFTRMNKRGQRLNLYTCDPKGVTGQDMYKPVPFVMSSRGYGVFFHTACPLTLDVGRSHSAAFTAYLDETSADLFLFLGSPREILESYTALTGRSPAPPVWSYGLWMSRCTYKTGEEVLEVAERMREHKVPCDVIHIDTGWFETDWRCDFAFSPTRFPDAPAMLARLKEMGYRVSLWQLPYFFPTNSLFDELVEKGYAVSAGDGTLPTEDAVLDFSNSEATKWYQKKLTPLFEMGVTGIKADFGEAAPLNGRYASGLDGRREHNLYPLRYQQAVFEATRQALGEGQALIWARAGWAGCQRYPIHWGGDCESTDVGMAASLRGGLSLGACGYSFWSHDIGGFCKQSPEELYLRWLAFGVFSSHARCHGQVPKEPWTLSKGGLALYRRLVETRYRLIPYLYTQGVLSARRGLPMLRPLFVDCPDDPLAWELDDEYLLGDSLLVAPLLEAGENTRWVYLPRGEWIDYQSGEAYEGGRMHRMAAGDLPIVVLVRQGSLIPHAPPAQHTGEIDWNALELMPFPDGAGRARGALCLPGEEVRQIEREG